VTTTIHSSETETSLSQAYAQLESIKEMVEALEHANQAKEHERSTSAWATRCWLIAESALSVQVRSGWHVPGDEAEAEEYTILLQAPKSMSSRRGDPCMPAEEKALRAVALKRFGGPAVRIVGKLNQYGEPVTATLEHQDWFAPWTRVDLRTSTVLNAEGVMLTYARQFYFGG
jgi:hypothetical protein